MKADETKPTNPYHMFLRMTYRLRRAQKLYEQRPTSTNLKTKKQFETQVDKWLTQCGFEAEKIKQMTFDSEKQN